MNRNDMIARIHNSTQLMVVEGNMLKKNKTNKRADLIEMHSLNNLEINI